MLTKINEIINTDTKQFLSSANVYPNMVYIHQAVVVTKYRTEKLVNDVINKFYRDKEIFYSFVNHSNLKMRNIFNSILNNALRGSCGTCLECDVLERNLVYSLEQTEG